MNSTRYLRILATTLIFGGWGVGCAHDLDGPSPAGDGAFEPHLVCNEREPLTRVTLTGSGLSPMPVDTATEPAALELPALTLTRTGDLEGNGVEGVPVEVPDDPEGEGSIHWYSQSRMDIDITPELALEPGIYGLTIRNPNGQEVEVPEVLAVVPPPELIDIEPDAICVDQQDVTVRLIGQGFLMIDGETPTVTVTSADEERTFRPDEVAGCATLPAPATDAERCSELTFTIPQGDLPPGEYEVVITNPPPADCSSSQVMVLEVVPPPELTEVLPRRICTSGGSIGLHGTGFREGATVEVGGLEARSVEVDPGGESATAIFGPGLAAGIYDATIINPDGCSSTLEDAVEVVQGPIIFWVDPPVVYNGISTQITIYGSDLASDVEGVELVPIGDGDAVPLEFSTEASRGRIQAVVPSGTPPGTYHVVVEMVECPAELPEGLVVTDSLTLELDSIDPSFGWTDRSSPVSLFGDGFISTPRAYLNPEDPTPETVAMSLEAVAFVDGARLTAVVPPGLPEGVYDVIVVNPTGEVGLIEGGFTVTTDPPPSIDNLSPGEVDSGGVRTINLRGGNFRDPAVGWTCQPLSGEAVNPAGTVSSWEDGSAVITLDATALTAGTVCVLRLTNGDGAYTDFSAVAITNPSSNIQPFQEATDMTTGRRGLALVAGHATRAARFLYALGGDDGREANALDSSESAAVDIFGQIGEWFDQPNGLAAPVTLTTATRIGRFIYIVGGHDGTSAVADVARATILDPLDSPDIVDISVQGGEGAGLGPGIWYYRVSAVFPETHPSNPGGEGLPSDPLVINLPDSLPDTLLVTIYWSEVPGAEAYRIYRSPGPATATGSERLLVEVSAADPRELEDDGAAPTGDVAPLPLGAHGTWVSLPSLGTPRAGLGLGHALDPDDPDIHYLYAVGGVDARGAALDTYEILAIEVASDRDQTVAASWVPGDHPLALARSRLGVFSVDHHAAPRVDDGTTYIYAVGGLGGSGRAVSDAEAALVTPEGQLGPWIEVDAARARAGFAHVAASNFLYMLGGGPSATDDAVSAEICGAGITCSGGDNYPPYLRNWNNEGISLTTNRYLPGSTLESAFIFVVGGADAGGSALSSSEQTVW